MKFKKVEVKKESEKRDYTLNTHTHTHTHIIKYFKEMNLPRYLKGKIHNTKVKIYIEQKKMF